MLRIFEKISGFSGHNLTRVFLEEDERKLVVEFLLDY